MAEESHHHFIKSTFYNVGSSIILGVALFAGPVCAEPDPGGETVDFAREILPILSNNCFVCHGPGGRENEVLRLDSFAAATQDLGGYRAIDPDMPESSDLLTRIHSADDPMSPKDAEKQLVDAERELLARWIAQGGNYATHWSFIAPRKQPPHGSKSATKVATVDAFVQARLRQEGVEFAH